MRAYDGEDRRRQPVDSDSKPEWAEFFDDHAPKYDDNVFVKNTKAEVAFVMDLLGLKPGMRILDLGCGTGRHAVPLAEKGLAVTGLDLSAGMLDQARKRAHARGVNVQWVQGDARDFDLGEPFDALICLCEGSFGLLSTAEDALAQPMAILRSASKALKPGAPCLFTVLNGYRMCRCHDQDAVERGVFDPWMLAETSDCTVPETGARHHLRERGFVPSELVLLFGFAGLGVRHLWGGTAGNWGRRGIELDEYEIMVLGHKLMPGVQPVFRVPTEL